MNVKRLNYIIKDCIYKYIKNIEYTIYPIDESDFDKSLYNISFINTIFLFKKKLVFYKQLIFHNFCYKIYVYDVTNFKSIINSIFFYFRDSYCINIFNSGFYEINTNNSINGYVFNILSYSDKNMNLRKMSINNMLSESKYLKNSNIEKFIMSSISTELIYRMENVK